MTTPNQIRAARALAGLSQDDVASLVKTSTKTIRRAEAGEKSVSAATIREICAALETKGIEFIPENGGGAGVRLKKEN